MSDIVPETATPGAWPYKGESKEGSAEHNAATPRSSLAASHDVGLCPGEPESGVDMEQGEGEYSHRDIHAERQKLGEAQGEPEMIKVKAGGSVPDVDQETVKMENIQPKPMEEGKGKSKEAVKEQAAADTGNKKSALTGMAKWGFAKAAQNSQVQGAFLKAAKDMFSSTPRLAGKTDHPVELPSQAEREKVTPQRGPSVEEVKDMFSSAPELAGKPDRPVILPIQEETVKKTPASPPFKLEAKDTFSATAELAGETDRPVVPTSELEEQKQAPEISAEEGAAEPLEKPTDVQGESENVIIEPEEKVVQEKEGISEETDETALHAGEHALEEPVSATDKALAKGQNASQSFAYDAEHEGHSAEGEIPAHEHHGVEEPIHDQEGEREELQVLEPVAEKDSRREGIPEGEKLAPNIQETAQEKSTTCIEKQKADKPLTGEELQEEKATDCSILKNGTVNKGGNVIDEDGKPVGRVTEGVLQQLIGRKVDENGNIWSSSGTILGKAEPIPEDEREILLKEPAPFENFPDAKVSKNGMVISNDEVVGKVVKGDLAIVRGKAVDPDGDILDRSGNVIGHAESWEPEPEIEVDKSIMAGKRVNKAGNIVDGSGTIFGRVVEGDVRKMIGRMCDKNGNVLGESGDILGKADLVPEGEREGMKEGPFAELQGSMVVKDGTIITPAGDIVGRLVKGDPKLLFGRQIDEDGDVLDKNGNVIGFAERWEPEKVEKKRSRMYGRRVNREGNVVDEDGNVIGKLTSGDVRICGGKEIDEDGDVVDSKGNIVGHCSLIEDILPEESAEEKEQRKQVEQDKRLATQMAVCIEQCLDSIRPICKLITEVSEAVGNWIHGYTLG